MHPKVFRLLQRTTLTNGVCNPTGDYSTSRDRRSLADPPLSLIGTILRSHTVPGRCLSTPSLSPVFPGCIGFYSSYPCGAFAQISLYSPWGLFPPFSRSLGAADPGFSPSMPRFPFGYHPVLRRFASALIACLFNYETYLWMS